MKTDSLLYACRPKCDHRDWRSYSQRRFDILYGFEINMIRCINCHKTLSMEAKKF